MAVGWAAPVKAWVQRFAFVLLLLTAFALMLLSKAETVVAERARTLIVDQLTPVLVALGRPVEAIQNTIGTVNGLFYVRAENARLLEENARLKQWLAYARELQVENTALRAELGYVADPEPRFITARVVADPGSAFVHSVLINAGTRQAIRRGQPVMAEGGLIGRITEVGRRSARVLLVTDINSRIPVILESNGDRGVLAGDNSARPRLLYLPAGAGVAPGGRIVTSGHGGVFPPGLAVGTVASVGADGEVRVLPAIDYARLARVRVLDFGAEGILPAPSPAGGGE